MCLSFNRSQAYIIIDIDPCWWYNIVNRVPPSFSCAFTLWVICKRLAKVKGVVIIFISLIYILGLGHSASTMDPLVVFILYAPEAMVGAQVSLVRLFLVSSGGL